MTVAFFYANQLGSCLKFDLSAYIEKKTKRWNYMRQARQIFRDAILLTVASLLMRTVGIAFQVYVSNRVGAEVMGLYSLMAGVYGFALTLATSGIHLGVTRIVAEFLSFQNWKKINGFMKTAYLYALLCGCAAASLLFFSAPTIGHRWISDTRAISSLRIFAISLPFIAISSVFGGYLTAIRKSYKNAGLQVAEQFVKISLTMLLFSLFPSPNTEALLCLLVLGGVCAEIISFLAGGFLLWLDRRKNRLISRENAHPSGGRELLKITLPMALTSYCRSGLLTLQHVLIPKCLRKSGASHTTALTSYGCIQSMTLPVVLFPAALISSFSGLLIPTMAECHVQNRHRQITYVTSRVWFFTMLYSIGTAGILICFSQELGDVLYPNSDTAKYIRLLSPLIPIMYLDTATDAMMKGLGEQLYSMKINIADAAISLLLVLLLIPRYGIWGYVITIYISELFNTVCSITHLLMISGTPVRLCKWVYKPLICIVGATVIVRFALERSAWRIESAALSIVLHILAVILVYVALLRLTKAVEKDDVRWVKDLFKIEKKVKAT